MERIEALILSGELKEGEQLPTERELAESMKVSKTVIHTSLKELEKMGFVEVRAKQGTFVSDYIKRGNFDTLAAILHSNGGHIDYENARSILEMRNAIEGEAVRLFAKRAERQDVEALRGCIDDITQAGPHQPRSELAQRLFVYHHTLCLHSGNSIFPLLMNAFREVGLVFWQYAIALYGYDGSLAILTALTELLEAKDGEGAAKYLEDYYAQFLSEVKPDMN